LNTSATTPAAVIWSSVLSH